MEQQPESFDNISNQEIHGHSFWLYTVVVGLSVEQALQHVLPHVGELSLELPRDTVFNIALEFIRLALFLTLVVRFYLGSVRYFSQAYLSELSDASYENKNYTYDFFFGLIHFSAFLALSLSIDAKLYHFTWLFWLSFILLYDFVWLISCRKYDTTKIIRFWAYLNGLTFIISTALWLLSGNLLSFTALEQQTINHINQTAFMLPIFIFSFLDIKEVLKSDPVLLKFLSSILKRK